MGPSLTTIVIIIFVIWFISGGFCGKIAGEKGYSVGIWFFLGVFFGVFALIAAAGLPNKKVETIATDLKETRLLIAKWRFINSLRREKQEEKASISVRPKEDQRKKPIMSVGLEVGKCPQCTGEVEKGDKFCKHCGYQLIKDTYINKGKNRKSESSRVTFRKDENDFRAF